MKIVNALLSCAVALTSFWGLLLLFYAFRTVPGVDLTNASAIQVTEIYTVMLARGEMGIGLLLVAILCAIVIKRQH